MFSLTLRVPMTLKELITPTLGMKNTTWILQCIDTKSMMKLLLSRILSKESAKIWGWRGSLGGEGRVLSFIPCCSCLPTLQMVRCPWQPAQTFLHPLVQWEQQTSTGAWLAGPGAPPGTSAALKCPTRALQKTKMPRVGPQSAYRQLSEDPHWLSHRTVQHGARGLCHRCRHRSGALSLGPTRRIHRPPWYNGSIYHKCMYAKRVNLNLVLQELDIGQSCVLYFFMKEIVFMLHCASRHISYFIVAG